EPCGGDGEGEQADRQGEHGFEEEVEPSAGVGGRGQQAAESLSLRTGGHLGDGSTPCPGTGPGQTPEGAGDGQGQWQEEETDPDDDGGDRGREQGQQCRHCDGGDDETGRDQEGVTAQVVPQSSPPGSTGLRGLCGTWHRLSVRVSGPGRTGRGRDGRSCGGGVHEWVPCCRVSEDAVGALDSVAGAPSSVAGTPSSVVGVRAARTVGWKRESIHTPPAPTAAEASRPAVAAAVRPVYSPKRAAPMITATIGSMTVSPASTVSAGPRA